MVLNKKKKNKGFTLVELIVAIAVLALLIVAVVTMMGHESVILKKHEADISVQTAAQETYNEISDILMQANSIKIEGWLSDGDIEFSKKEPGKEVFGVTISTASFAKKGEGATYNFEDNGSEMLNAGDDSVGVFLKTTNVNGSTSSSEYRNIYLSSITVKYSVPYDSSYAETAAPLGTDKDTCTAKIIFEANRVYITKTYTFMTKLNSTYSDLEDVNADNPAKEACLYTSKLNYATVVNAKLSAAIATVDVDNQSISLELRFADNGMTYNVNGITNVKNSYVFVDPK